MKKRLMVLMLVAGGALFAGTHVSIGVQLGGPVMVPPPPPPVVVNSYQPPAPGPGYVWIPGYYDQYGNWYEGYWALPPYTGAYWIAPAYNSGHFIAGYWTGPRGLYRAQPRVAAPPMMRGNHNGFNRPMAGRNQQEFRNAPGSRGGAFGRGAGMSRGSRR